MTDLPQWAVEKARELAAMWNDPGQEAAIARALAEAAKPGWRTDMDSVPEGELVWLFEPHSEGGFQFAGVRVAGEWRNNLDAQIQHPTHWMPLPAAPEVR